MMRWLIETSMKLRFLVIILAAVILVFGSAQLRAMPVDVYPEFDPPLVEIQTEALGLAAAEVEAMLTVPMEADLLNGVAWLEQIYSESVAGLSSILLVFEPGTDPIRARQMVQERLIETFALPNVSLPPTMLQPLSTTSRVMMVGLSSDELSLIDVGVLARWNIKPRLMGVPGVANVAIWGLREWQLQVQVDPEQLQERGVSLDQVIATTGEALWVSPLSYLESSTPGTAGWIDTPNQRLSIRHQLPISSAQDLVQVPVKGTAWRLGDVAEVVEDHQLLIGDAVLKDGPGLLLVIEKFPGANTLEVTRGVEAALEAMRPGLTGIEIDTTVFRPANYLELAIGNLSTVLLIAAFLVVLVLFAFLYEWRTALVGLVAIVLSLLAVVFVLYLRGSTFNVMILVGLVVALGVVVDDAIIATYNIARRFRQHSKENMGDPEARPSPESIILEASLEMRSSLSFALLILLLAVLPVFFLQGLSGSFFEPLALSYTLAVVTSLAVALIVTPALSLMLLSSVSLGRRQSPLASWLEHGYTSFLSRTIQTPRLAYLAVVVIVLAGLVALPFLKISLLPELKQTALRIQWQGPPGTSRLEMNRITARASRELQSIPGVRNVGSHVGRAITGDQVVGINSGELWVSLDPAADYEATLAAVRQVVGGYPGLFREVQAYQPKRIGAVLGATGRDLIVRIYGHEFEVLGSKAEEVRQVLAGIDGLVDLHVEPIVNEPQVEIEVDLAAAERYQVKPGEVRRAAATLLSGLRVGNLYEEQKVFDVVVWGVPEIRKSLTDIRELLIDTPRGGHVRLGDVAEVRIAPAPIIIRRDAVSRFIDVSANVRGRALTSVAADVKGRLQAVAFPLEYHAEVLGVSAGQQAARQQMLVVVVVAVIGSYLLLQAAFDSWRLASVAFSTLPVALAGGGLAALLNGGVLSVGSLFGFLTILGIAVRSALVMINHYQALEQQVGVSFGPELILRGARDRLAPILMTALTAGLALLPMALAGPIAGLEIVQPMAIVILGGLVTSTLLSLFVLPALVLRFGSGPEPVASFSREPVASN